MKKITFLMLAVPLVFAACSTTNNAPSNSNNAATTSATEKPPEKTTEDPKSTEAQTLESVLRLEALEKRLAAVEAQLARIVATTSGAAQSQLGQTGFDYTGKWVNENNEIMTINEVANGQYKIEGFDSAEGFTKFATMDEKGNLVARNHWGDHTFIYDKKNNRIISNNSMKGTHYWKKQK